MYIFLDESGSFLPAGNIPVSVVGALWITEANYDELVREYLTMRPGPLKTGSEVKGSQLTAAEVSDVVRLVVRHGGLFTAVAVDHGVFTTDDVSKHREEQARRIEANLTRNPYPAVQAQLKELAEGVSNLSEQLYVQFTAQTVLASNVLRFSTIYFATRRPKELAQFRWLVDSKTDATNPGGNPAELLWGKLVPGFLQSDFLRAPMPALIGADYSYFEQAFGVDKFPDYLLPFSKTPPTAERGMTVSARAIMSNMKFSADSDPGLELADIFTNTLRRALRGNLEEAGWREMPSAMVDIGRCYFELLGLNGGGGTFRQDRPYSKVWNAFRAGGQPLIASDWKAN